MTRAELMELLADVDDEAVVYVPVAQNADHRAWKEATAAVTRTPQGTVIMLAGDDYDYEWTSPQDWRSLIK